MCSWKRGNTIRNKTSRRILRRGRTRRRGLSLTRAGTGSRTFTINSLLTPIMSGPNHNTNQISSLHFNSNNQISSLHFNSSNQISSQHFNSINQISSQHSNNNWPMNTRHYKKTIIKNLKTLSLNKTNL